jgi:hypothetical protein
MHIQDGGMHAALDQIKSISNKTNLIFIATSLEVLHVRFAPPVDLSEFSG